MRAVEIKSYGNAVEAVKFANIDEPGQPGPGEVRVAVEFAPVNYNDILLLSGAFPVHPNLPSVAGNEGVGLVEAIGEGVSSLHVGDRVILPLYSFTWRERMIVAAADVFCVPPTIPPQQAAMLRINPPTAALLLSEYAALDRGDWVLQNAANSGVGRSVMAIAKARGLRTVNLVRRADAITEVEGAGGDVVLVDDAGAPAEIAERIGGAPLKLAIDGVFGDASARLIKLLAPGGTLVNYAQMSGAKAAVADLRDIMRKNLTVRDFYQGAPRFKAKIPLIMEEVMGLAVTGRLEQHVAQTYRLEQAKEALAHVLRGGRVMFDVKAE